MGTHRFARGVVALLAVLATALAAIGDGLPRATTAATIDLAAFNEELSIAELPGTDAGNFSGVAFDAANDRILVVVNEPEQILEYNGRGNKLLRTIQLAGFDDPEAIVRLRDDEYAVAEEKLGHISTFRLGGDTRRIEKRAAAVTTIVMEPNPTNGDNTGIEGLAYDAKEDCFYAVKEKSPLGVFRVQRKSGKNTTEVNVPDLARGKPGVSDPVKDLSDCFYAAGSLYVLSHESAVVVQVRLDGDRGAVVGQFPDLGKKLPHPQAEGLAFWPDGNQLLIIGEPRQYVRYRRKVTGSLREP